LLGWGFLFSLEMGPSRFQGLSNLSESPPPIFVPDVKQPSPFIFFPLFSSSVEEFLKVFKDDLILFPPHNFLFCIGDPDLFTRAAK